MEAAGVDRGGQQVVGGCDGVDISCQMQVEVFHRDHLAVATSGGTALDAKCWTLAWLPDAGEDSLTEMCTHSLAQPYRSGRLPLTQRCRGDRCDQHVFAIRFIFKTLQNVQADFGFVISIQFQLFAL